VQAEAEAKLPAPEVAEDCFYAGIPEKSKPKLNPQHAVASPNSHGLEAFHIIRKSERGDDRSAAAAL